MSADEDHHEVLVFNPLPWSREISGRVPEHVLQIRGAVGDTTSGRHFQDRDPERGLPAAMQEGAESDASGPTGYVLPPTEIPGFGYTVVTPADIQEQSEAAFDERTTVETASHHMVFDRKQGGIKRWRSKTLDREVVDDDSAYPLGGFVHEEVADKGHPHPRQLLFDFGDVDWGAAAAGLPGTERGFNPDWHAHRTVPNAVVRHRVYETPLGYDVRQRLDVPQVKSDVELRTLVPKDGDTITVEATWTMGMQTHPESTYLAFPFRIADPTPRVDVGGQAMQPGEDQLDGGCYDYYTAQRWVDITGDDFGVTVGTPLSPMVQFGDFTFAQNQPSFEMDRPLLLGWVTNNYWDTNFRARQPGRVQTRYHLTPHEEFEEARAHRLGLEAEHAAPLAQTATERSESEAALARQGSLLDLPEPPVLVLQIRSEAEGDGVFHPGGVRESDAILALVKNTSDDAVSAQFASGALQIQEASRVGFLGATDGETLLSVEDGSFETELAPREMATVRFEAGLDR